MTNFLYSTLVPDRTFSELTKLSDLLLMIGDHILQKLYFGSIFELAFDAIEKAIFGDLHYQVVNIRRMLDEFALLTTSLLKTKRNPSMPMNELV